MGSRKMRNCGAKYIRQAPTVTNKNGQKEKKKFQQIVLQTWVTIIFVQREGT